MWRSPGLSTTVSRKQRTMSCDHEFNPSLLHSVSSSFLSPPFSTIPELIPNLMHRPFFGGEQQYRYIGGSNLSVGASVIHGDAQLHC